MICPHCSQDVESGALFCPSCGKMLSAQPAPEVEATPVDSANESTNNGAYTPPPSYTPQAENTYTPPVGYTPPVNNTYTPPASYTPPATNPYNTTQQPYQQPYNPYNPTPAAPAAQGDASKNWAAITGMVLAILSIVSCITTWGMLLCIPALIFSIVGMKSQKRGMAIAGLIISIISILLFVFLLVMAGALIASGELDNLLNDLYYYY